MTRVETAEAESWHTMGPFSRSSHFRRASKNLRNRADTAQAESRSGLQAAADIFESFADEIEANLPSEVTTTTDEVVIGYPVPLGSIGLRFDPQCTPATVAFHLAGALAAGNVVVVSVTEELAPDQRTILRSTAQAMPESIVTMSGSQASADVQFDKIASIIADVVSPSSDLSKTPALVDRGADPEPRSVLKAYSMWNVARFPLFRDVRQTPETSARHAGAAR